MFHIVVSMMYVMFDTSQCLFYTFTAKPKNNNCMEKKIVLTLLILYWLGMQSQVGINTPGSKTTLDVGGVSVKPTILDGSIAPRITGAQLKTKKNISAEREFFVFGTDADTVPSSQTVNVTCSGYFFFDGNVRERLVDRNFDTTYNTIINNPSNTNERVELGTNSNGSVLHNFL